MWNYFGKWRMRVTFIIMKPKNYGNIYENQTDKWLFKVMKVQIII